MPFPVVVMYPCDAPEACKKLGSFTLNASMNGRVAVGSFPLVVISHGTGGSHLSHRTLAAHLARNGNVVALLEHPVITGTITNWQEPKPFSAIGHGRYAW